MARIALFHSISFIVGLYIKMSTKYCLVSAAESQNIPGMPVFSFNYSARTIVPDEPVERGEDGCSTCNRLSVRFVYPLTANVYRAFVLFVSVQCRRR